MLRKVLVVEDSPVNRKVLHGILRREYDVFEAENGKEALEILHRKHKLISAVILDIAMPVMDGYEVLKCMRENAVLSQIPVIVATAMSEENAEERALALGANDFITKPYNSVLLMHCLRNTINLRETASIVNAVQRDKLTGLYNREAFFGKVESLLAEREPGHFVMTCFDIDNFKVINDQYGADEGDRILRHVGKCMKECFGGIGGIASRISADNFAALYPAGEREIQMVDQMREDMFVPLNLRTVVTCSVGRYVVSDLSLSASAVYDRAYLAKQSVKGRYDQHIAYFNESMRDKLIADQEIIGDMDAALSGQFEIWLQPQLNHATGALVGAEALVRWRHPTKGLIPPAKFIPVFEQNGFIYEMDKNIWTLACALLRRWLDEGREPLPLSVNISRYDIFKPDFFQTLTGMLERYRLSPELLRLEITESAFAKSAEPIIAMVRQLIEYGFTIEIDDFGSGYSSLNTLKDVPATVLKLDMKFFDATGDTRRGGNIVESVVRMAKWLGMATIAEGVEDRDQADYLKSIGCNYIQGYLYFKPMPIPEFEQLAARFDKEGSLLALKTVENLDNNAFWDPKSMDTLIFNSYVGGACIFEYHNGDIELLRANDQYVQMIGAAGLRIEDAMRLDWAEHLEESDRDAIKNAMDLSLETGESVTGEYVFLDLPGCPKETYLRATMRVIASSGDHMLVYCTNENTTPQRQAEKKEHETAEHLSAIMRNITGGVTASVLRDGAMRLIFANEQFYEQRGYTRAQYEREVGDPQETVYPEDRARIRELSLTASQTCLPYSAVYRVVRRNGEVRWLQKNVSITSFASEEEPVHLSVSNDITEQKEAQQTLMETDDQLRFLNTIAHELLAQPDSDIGLQSVLEKLLSYFRGERAYIFELDPGEDTVSNTYEVCKEGVTPQKDSLQRLPVEMCQFWIRSFDDKSYIDVPDVDTLDDSRAEEKEVLRAQGIRSLIAVPLERDGKLIGFIGVDDPSRQHARVDRLMALGDYIAVMLTHRDLDRKILNDNETLLSLMNDTPGGFVRMRVRPDGAIVPIYFNQGFQTLVGMNNDELMALYGEDAMAGVHPDDLAVVYAAVAGMRKSGEAHSSAYRLRHGAGGYVRVMFFGRMKKSASGEEFLNIYYTDAARDDIAVLVGAENQADQRVKLLTDSIPGGLATYLCTPDKISVQYFNDGFCRLFGFDRAGFFQQSSVDPRVVVFEQDLPLLMRQVRALIERGDPIDCVYRVHTKDGGYKWIEHKAVAAGKTDGGVLVNAVLLDVTRQHEATERLRISEEEHRLAVAQSGNIICRYSVADKTMHMSRETADTLSLPEQIIDVPYGPVRLGMISRENEQAYIDFFESIDRGEKTGTMVFSHLMTGVWRWMEAHFSTIFADDGKPVSAVITFYDVTERLWKEAVYNKWQQSMQEKDPGSYTLFRSNLSKSASFDTMEGKLLWADFGADTDSFNGRTREYADQCVFESDREEYVALLNSDTLLANYYRGKRNYVMEYREKLQSGGVRWLRLTVDLVEYPNSTEVEAYLMYENIDDSKRAELLTIERAEMDPLTCVLNRATFAARADRILRDSRPDERHAFLMIDIDSFKMVNDVFGHAAGDQALVDTAAAIRAALRREDLVGRLGGDEFVAFLRDIPNDAVAATKARSICANMRKALSLEVQISGSIGIVVSPRDGADFQTLYQKADAALYHVKGSGKDNFAFYGEDMRDEHLKPEGEPAGDARAPHVEKKRRMLIVDDSVIDHAMLANIFDDEFIIERAKDGSNALIRLRHYGTAISVVLLDLFMPGMNGFEVLEKMQAAAELQAIPVIVVSGDDNRETSLRAIRAGATDFVTKPVDAELLRIRVQSAISKAENERLRAQNSFLEMQRDELAKFRTVLAHTGTALLEYDWVKGAFSYDASMSAHIDGIWDKRTLWRILLSDMVADVSTVRRMQEFVHSVADDRKTQSGSIIVPLRTPSRETRQFRMNVYKESDAFQLTNRLVITFNDVEDGGQATDTETI